MIPVSRMILLIGSSTLTIAGTFLPWVQWNNLWKDQGPAVPRLGGAHIYQPGHANDPVYVWNGSGMTGGFDVMVTTYDKGVQTSRISASTEKLPTNWEVFLVPAGLLVLVAAFLRRKWLVSLLCIPAVVAPAAVMSVALQFVSVAKKLEASRGYESLDPTLGVGMFILLLGAILALVGGGIVWAEPRVGRRSPPHVVPHAGG